VRSGTIVKPALVAVVVTSAVWLIGLDLGHALLLGGAGVIIFELQRVPDAEPVDGWPVRHDDSVTQGVRREVARLSWGMQGIEARVDHRSVIRLQESARRRLASSGIELDEPADADRARELLGALPFQVLTSDRNFRPTFDQFARAIAAVEGLTLDAGSSPHAGHRQEVTR
jgi:hypothetical protein